MAATISNSLMDKGISVKFATSSSIIEEIKKSWSKTSIYTESNLIDALIQTDVLVIDDFGTESLREWINDKFYYIINERYINERTTIYTSNYKLDELQYDERIINRIRENCYQIPFPEESIREQIEKENTKEMASMIRKNKDVI
ncbi:helicase loader DnaI [Lachnospiraceae bacterium KM106-2]|nr:helicase loader DnaI [Lachnospiraceae bacterium KM106-2]